MPALAVLLCGFLLSRSKSEADTPAVDPPGNTRLFARDTCANDWALATGADGRQRLFVLPAQDPLTWREAAIPGIESAVWHSIVAAADGGVVVSNTLRSLRFDPREARPFAREAASGHPPASSPSPWRTVARMPASNHDLTAAVLGGYVYVAGGLTADWGFPARPHAFDEIWRLDPESWTWKAVSKFAHPRIYCAVATFDNAVWVVGGDTLLPNNTRVPSTTVDVFDPKLERLAPGPRLTVAHHTPLALVAGGRLYVMGAPGRTDQGRMDSIGPGEGTWRREPDGPIGMWALAGAVLDDGLYVCVPGVGLAVFDPATRRWDVLGGPTHPRSGQVAAWHGELWLMGGRDIADQSETRIFNPRTRTWRAGPSLPRELAWGAAAVVGDHLIVTGGAAGPGYNDRTFVLDREPAAPWLSSP